MNTAAPTLQMRFGAAVLTLRKPTPIKAFPYFHCVSPKTRCKIRESYFAVLIVRPDRNKKMLPHRFRWGIDYVLFFIIFLFCRRCSFSRSRRCIYLNSQITLFGSDRSKNSLLASSSQAPYPSFRRKRQNSLAPLLLLSPKSPKDFSGTPYGVILAYFNSFKIASSLLRNSSFWSCGSSFFRPFSIRNRR